jgi:hypothetical protein
MFDFCSSTSSLGSARVDAFVVIVDGDRQRFLRALLADHVLVEDVIDLFRLRNVAKPEVLIDVLVELFLDDLVAELDTLIANVNARPGDQFPNLLLRLAAEATFQLTLLVAESKHESRSARFARSAFSLLKIWSTIRNPEPPRPSCSSRDRYL